MNLQQEIFFNFMSQEAFKTLQNAKPAFITSPGDVIGFFIGALFAILVLFGLFSLAKRRNEKQK